CIFFDYLLVPDLWKSFALWRGIALVAVVSAMLWHSFASFSALVLNYLLYLAVGLPLLPMLVAVPSQHLGVYLLQYTMAYLSLGALLIIAPLHAYIIAALSLGSQLLLLYWQEGFSLQSYGLQGGLLAMGSVVVGMLISTHRFGVQSKRLRTLAASERAKSLALRHQCYAGGAEKGNRKENQEIDAQNEALQEQNRYISTQNQELALAYKQITDSINYAKRIQKAILGDIQRITEQFHEAFIFYEPKDIVSGDFYWFAESGDKLIIAVADCTGHGVPGAFMALIGNNLLNEIVNIKGIVHTSAILQHLHQGIIQALHQPESKRNDGMEIAVCCIHKRRRWIEYAGARIPLVYIQNGRLFEVAADGFSIGGLWHNSERVAFHHHIVPLHEDTHFYLLTDGYKDQFGGAAGKKFMRKRLNELLLKIHQESPEKQQAQLQEALQDWMGEQVQVDDILVMGFQMNKDLTIEPTASKSLLQSLSG
ncbi:MAG: SpoIIE family protein phosphatase, partial [Saprospiraceae bacterium]|nr:SpoIIE family protein phosphatase [Saprospiraceae bacterium]